MSQTSHDPLTTTFVKLRGTLLRRARRMLGSQEDAEDALQEAFLRLWPRAGSLSGTGEAEALASMTLRNLSIDVVRKRQREQKALDTDLNILPLATDDEPHTRIEDKLLAAQALMQKLLTPLQQDIIRMREYDDRSYASIAKELHMEEAAVRMQLSRARKKLRDYWKTTYTDL